MANTHDADIVATPKAGKRTKCERYFLDQKGETHARSFGGVAGVQLHFVESDDKLTMMLNELSQDILLAAAAFGLNTSVGNTFGAIQDLDEAFEAAEARWEQLKSGEWSAERTVGPRVKDVHEAVKRYLAAAGKDVDDDAIAEKLADPATLKGLQADPKVGVHLAAIRKERAEERARVAAEKASKSEAPSAADSLFA